jgi:hypothetical protein
MSGNFGGWEDWEGGRILMILSPVMNVFSQLYIHSVSYHSGDYAEKDMSTALLFI